MLESQLDRTAKDKVSLQQRLYVALVRRRLTAQKCFHRDLCTVKTDFVPLRTAHLERKLAAKAVGKPQLPILWPWHVLSKR